MFSIKAYIKLIILFLLSHNIMGKITKRILANIFFFLLIFQSLSAQNSQRIDLSLKEQTLKVFLEIVEQKTNYTFMYNNLDLEQKISGSS